jgi:hypothetical protein
MTKKQMLDLDIASIFSTSNEREKNQIVKVIPLKGTGDKPKEEDKKLIRKALIDLGVL